MTGSNANDLRAIGFDDPGLHVVVENKTDMKRILCSFFLLLSLISLGFSREDSVKTVLADSAGRVQTSEKNLSIQEPDIRYGVAPFKDTLFYISNRIGSHSALERANSISKRIRSLYEAPFFYPDSLVLVQNDLSMEIHYLPDMIMMSVTPMDAASANKSMEELAKENLKLIKKAIENERELFSFFNVVKRLGWIAVVLVIFGLIIYLINYCFRILNAFLKRNTQYFQDRIRIFNSQLIDSDLLEEIIFKISGFLKLFLIVLVVLITFPILFSISPVTRMWAATLLGWVITPLKSTVTEVWLYLPKLFSVIVIYLIFKYIIKFLKYLFTKISDGTFEFDGFHREWATPTFSIVRFLMYAFMLVLIFPLLPGSGSDAFKGVSVFLGIIFSLGSSSVIGNILAGLVITYMRPFKIGDRIKIGEITGDVIEKTSLVTRIRTVKNEDITVPNSTILSSNTINYSANSGENSMGLIVHTSVTIGYDVPWREMYKALLEAADRTDAIQKEPKPFVLQTSLEDFYVTYQLNGYTRESGRQALVYSILHQNIQDCCNEAGIEIMSPHYSNLRDGNKTTVPAKYLPEDYQAPPFIVNKP